MSVSLASCLARSIRCAGSRTTVHTSFLPARSVTRLQRGRPLLHAAPLNWSVGSSRSFSWNPFGGSSKVEVTSRDFDSGIQDSPQPVVEENMSAAAEAPVQSSVDSIAAQADTPSFVNDGSLTDTISDSLSNATTALAAHSIPTQYGDMAALGLVSWSPAGFFPWVLEVTQVSTGLPWWSAIILTTVGARIALLPLIVKAQRMQSRMGPIQPLIKEISDKTKKALAEGDTFAVQQARQQQAALLSKAGVNPLDSILTAVAQVCVQIGFFIGLRRMCDAPVEQLKDGGFSWIQDLTLADPYYITPFINYALIQLQLTLSARDVAAVGTPAAPHILNLFRVLSLVGMSFMMFFPAALNIHLITSIAFISAQTLALRLPALRRALKLAPLAPAKKQPGMKDSFIFAKEWYTGRMKETAAQEAIRQRKMRMVQRPPPRK